MMFRRHVLRIPRAKATTRGFSKLFEFYSRCQTRSSIKLDFSLCTNVQQHTQAFVGGAIRALRDKGVSVEIDWASCSPQTLFHLQRTGFAEAFGGPVSTEISDDNVIPFRVDPTIAPSEIVEYLQQKWLGRGWVKISDPLKALIVGRVWEIYANAFEHSGTAVGVTTCGYHFKDDHKLALTVVDFGRGIVGSVREFRNSQAIPSPAALEWAFRRGTSTKRFLGRGLGLDLLKQFVKINHGQLEVYSDNGQARVSDQGDEYLTHPVPFAGTLVHITFICDSKSYALASEIPRRPLF